MSSLSSESVMRVGTSGLLVDASEWGEESKAANSASVSSIVVASWVAPTTQFDIFPPERVQLHQESGNIFSIISSEGNRTADLRACFFTIYAVTLLTFIIQEEI